MQRTAAVRCESPIIAAHRPKPSGDAAILLQVKGMNVIQDNRSDCSSASSENGSDRVSRSYQCHQKAISYSGISAAASGSYDKKKRKKRDKMRRSKRGKVLRVGNLLSHAEIKLKSIVKLKNSNIVAVPRKGSANVAAAIVDGQFEDAVEPDLSSMRQYQNKSGTGYSKPPFGYFSLHPSTLSLHPPSATHHFYPSTPVSMNMGISSPNFLGAANAFNGQFPGNLSSNPNGMPAFQQTNMNGRMHPGNILHAVASSNFQQLHQQGAANPQLQHPIRSNGLGSFVEFAASQRQQNSSQQNIQRSNNDAAFSGQVPLLPKPSNAESAVACANGNNKRPYSAMSALAEARNSKDPAAAAAVLSRLHGERKPPPEIAPAQHAQPQPLMAEMRAFSAAVQQQQRQQQQQQKQQKKQQQQQPQSRILAPDFREQLRHAIPAESLGSQLKELPFYVDGKKVPCLIDADMKKWDRYPMLPFVKPDSKKKNPVLERDITHCDVLLGRGGMTNHHIGNMHFRKLVSNFRMHYVIAKKGDKALLSKTLTNYVRHKNGRFLQKNDRDHNWYECGDQRAHAKFAQALREGASELAEKLMGGEQPAVENSNCKASDTEKESITPPPSVVNATQPAKVSQIVKNRRRLHAPPRTEEQSSPRFVVSQEKKENNSHPARIDEEADEEVEAEERRKRMKIEEDQEGEAEQDAAEQSEDDVEYI